jgi:signal transduction histidine kinase/ActR/RegA family two-component response regulator
MGFGAFLTTVGRVSFQQAEMLFHLFFDLSRDVVKTSQGRTVFSCSALLFLWVLLTGGLVESLRAGEVAADYAQPWQVIVYSRETELSQQRFFDIAFTSNNTAWIAASDGLRQFDGFDWTLYGTNQGLPSSFVRAVCVDRRDQLWVGSDAGAGLWHRQTGNYQPHGQGGGLANENIREIDEDPDGTMWFSCDQWPETTPRPGGLSCFKGDWQTFRQTNGVPMDYVIGYFRDSGGRQFVLTPNGWGMRRGGTWGTPPGTGYEAESRVLQMAEARDGTLFAQGERMLLTFKDGHWRSHPESRTRCVCATRNGEVVAAEWNPARGQLWFSLWDGEKFVRASTVISCPADRRLYHLREAPDGSLWCVGTGVLVRWNFRAGQWSFFPQLPPPVAADREGHVWFADGSNVVVRADGIFHTIAAGSVQVWPGAGQVMIFDRERRELFLTDPLDPLRKTLVTSACKIVVQAVAAPDALWWILGQDQDGKAQLLRYRDGTAKAIPLPGLAGRQLTVGRLDQGTLWMVAQDANDQSYGVARVSEDQVEWLSFTPSPPPLPYPGLVIGGGRRWLTGYPGIFQQSLDTPDRWLPDAGISDTGTQWGLGRAEEELMVFSGGYSGRSCSALFASNRWARVEGVFEQPTYGLDRETIYLPCGDGVFIRRRLGTLELEYLQLPTDAQANVALDESGGGIWVGTSEGTFRYQPGRVPPVAILDASTREIRQTASLPVSFQARTSFARGKNPRCFRYSWCVDQGDWSPFVVAPASSLALPRLATGAHVLEMRARDVDGNVSSVPAQLAFTVLPVPLQQHVWFWPVVTVVAAALVRLVWLRTTHLRQIAATNTALRQEIIVRRGVESELEAARRDLERRVVERTAELTQANESLNREIVERQTAQEHQRRLEQQLHQVQKLEAIGTLAGGIAHDFNNILAIIVPHCHLLIEDLQKRPDLQDQLRDVLKATDRAKDLVQQILTFSRQKQEERRVVELQPIVEETAKLLRSVMPATIQIVQELQPASPVLVDATQMHQVIMNLCVNARHAMKDGPGRLEIGLADALVDATQCVRSADLSPGRYVRLWVRDNGCGIPPEVIGRIFEPFFTTKEAGQGTGLGLAVVHGIIKCCNGAILVESQPGVGTIFEIFLPAQPAAASAASPNQQPAPPAQGELILIVDDETAITRIMTRMLARVGYQVVAYNDPEGALEYFQSHAAAVKLILTDLTMPGMTGLELAEKVAALQPDLPVILATGFGGGLVSPAQLVSHPNIRKLVEKPVGVDLILGIVAEALRPPASKFRMTDHR